MARTEAELRKEAVRRRLAGESAEEIARSLGRSPRWVQKWVRRHEPGEGAWAEGRKRGPGRPPNRTAATLEAQVLAVREWLMANPWAQVGAEAIAWELRKLGVESPPRRTIERILARTGTTRRRGRGRRQPKSVPYPAPVPAQTGDVHEADLVGPRHLAGGVRFYALNAIDLASHRAGIAIVPDRSDERVAGGLVALWNRLGLPVRLKLDNGGPFVPPRGLGLVARLSLLQGVIPHFIPPREPWRKRDRRALQRHLRQALLPAGALLLTRPVGGAGAGVRDLPQRQPPLPGKRRPHPSGDGACQPDGKAPPARAELPQRWPRQGRVEFVRFIRSDRKLRLLNRAITMPETVIYEYVTAILDLALPPTKGNLRVLREGEIVATASITIGGR